MAGVAAVGLDDVEPLALILHVGRHAVALVARAGEQGLLRNVQHREPVDRRIIFGRCGGVRREGRGNVDDLAGRALGLRRIHEAVAARPDLEVRFWQIRDDIAALIVGHHSARKLRREISRLSDDPDAGFRPLRTRHHAADVLLADGDGCGRRGLLSDGGRRQKAQCGNQRNRRDAAKQIVRRLHAFLPRRASFPRLSTFRNSNRGRRRPLTGVDDPDRRETKP